MLTVQFAQAFLRAVRVELGGDHRGSALVGGPGELGVEPQGGGALRVPEAPGHRVEVGTRGEELGGGGSSATWSCPTGAYRRYRWAWSGFQGPRPAGSGENANASTGTWTLRPRAAGRPLEALQMAAQAWVRDTGPR